MTSPFGKDSEKLSDSRKGNICVGSRLSGFNGLARLPAPRTTQQHRFTLSSFSSSMAQTKSHSRSSLDRFSPINLKPVQDDAWSSIFKPPPNESAEEKRERIARQQEAQRVSREIDEGILESKKLFDKKKKAIKVLLLGMCDLLVLTRQH
ncbi:hypothetical protein BDR04DRAFT_582270 [Suillus decipiens]|nr:hypothetical protein BDR04DRAFT_582270 [Suillus decipiens]